jgi:hypothetical protein
MTVSGQTQIIGLLVELKEDVAELKGIVPTVQALDKIIRLGNGKDPMTKRMDEAEEFINCQKKIASEKKDDQKWFKRTIIAAAIGQLILLTFAFIKLAPVFAAIK